MLKTNVSLADVKEWLSKGFECLPVGIDSLTFINCGKWMGLSMTGWGDGLESISR
jgi:hypothetical protein